MSSFVIVVNAVFFHFFPISALLVELQCCPGRTSEMEEMAPRKGIYIG